MLDSKQNESHVASVEMMDLGEGSDSMSKGNGTAQDVADMYRMGKRQDLKRDFYFISIVGFPTVMQGTWESTLQVNSFGLYDGGLAGVAELPSMAPTAGGQYHWVSEFAPASLQQQLSYVVGWFAFLSWVSAIPASGQIMTGLTHGLIVLRYPDANVETLWQTTLLIFLYMFLAFGFNIFCAKYMPLVEGIMLVTHVVLFFIFIFLLAFLPEHIPAKRVFTEFHDGGHWGSIGVANLFGITCGLWCFVGPDAGAHMSEELRDASYQLPRAMLLAAVGNGLLGVWMLMVFCTCIPNLQAAINSPSGYAILDILYASTGSYAATCTLIAFVIIVGFFGTCNVIAAASRQCGAFARDGGFPYSSWITQVRHSQPLNAELVCLAISFALACINFGSSVALNAIISISNAALVFTYMVSIGCITLKRLQGQPLLPRRFDLGWAGLPLNQFTMAWLTTAFVFSFFPEAPSVGDPHWARDFNWASVMFVAVAVMAFVYFITYGKRSYVPPVRLVKQL